MTGCGNMAISLPVTLHTEGVDRNALNVLAGQNETVTLHTEGVDRNPSPWAGLALPCPVTLHTEGVDRNRFQPVLGAVGVGHPPHGGCG